MPGVGSINGHMDNGAGAVAVLIGDAQPLHELPVSGGQVDPVYLGGNALAGDLPDVRHPAPVQRLAVGLLQTFADGMGGGAFCQSRQLQEPMLLQRAVVYAGDLKDPLGQGAGLIEDHRIHLGQGFQVVGALDQYALPAGTADTGKEAQGDGDDQGAGAGDDQEGQGPVDPVPHIWAHAQDQPDNGGQHRQSQGAVAHPGGIDPGELGDKVLGLGFPGGGVLHQVQDLGHGGLTEVLGGADLQHAGQVDAAADDLGSGGDLPGHALAGQGAGVQAGGALHHQAVDGHLLTGLDHNDAAHLYLIRVYLFQDPLPLYVGIVRADVHKLGDVPAALPHGVALEPLTDLVEQHNGNGLQIVAVFRNGQSKGTHCGHRHQEAFIKYLMIADALPGLFQNVSANDEIIHQISPQPHPAAEGAEHRVIALRRDQLEHDQQSGGNQDPDHGFFLFLCHVSPSFPDLAATNRPWAGSRRNAL